VSRRDLPILLAAGASLGVVLAYLLAGGASYKPLTVADPCEPRPLSVLSERGVFEGIALSALDGAACELGVTREELTIALADEGSLDSFAEERGLERAQVEAAISAGLLRAVDDAELQGQLSGTLASLARLIVENVPVGVAIGLFDSLPGDPSLAEVLDALAGLGEDIGALPGLGLEGLQGLGEDLEGLLPEELKGLGGLDPGDLEGLLPGSGP
jgi:hypothetical protein